MLLSFISLYESLRLGSWLLVAALGPVQSLARSVVRSAAKGLRGTLSMQIGTAMTLMLLLCTISYWFLLRYGSP